MAKNQRFEHVDFKTLNYENLTRTIIKQMFVPKHKLFGNSHLYRDPRTFFLEIGAGEGEFEA